MNHTVKYILCLGLLMLLVACGSTIITHEPQPALPDSSSVDLNAPAEPAYTPNPDIRETERFYYALRLLEQGEEKQARGELTAFLFHHPDSKKAREIIRQIDTPASEYFPSAFFETELQPGESLSVLARDYLGDLYAFYALAKYNNITKPSQLNAGKIIRIPLTETAAQIRKNLAKPAQASSPSTSMENASGAEKKSPVDHRTLMASALAQNDYATAITHLEKLRDSPGFSIEQQRQASDIYLGYAGVLENTAPPQAAWYYFEAAKLQIKLNRSNAALRSLRHSLTLHPDNPTASEIYTILKRELTAQYQRKAGVAYARQQWDLAIRLWTQVLDIDPEHQQAKDQLAEIKALKVQPQNMESPKEH